MKASFPFVLNSVWGPHQTFNNYLFKECINKWMSDEKYAFIASQVSMGQFLKV